MIDTLTGVAADVARELVKKFPDMVITSARRTIADQARVMAHNEVRERMWIERTYASTRPAQECAAWSAQHPKATEDELLLAFSRIIAAFPPDEQRKLSRHLTGEAFDVKPIGGAAGEELLSALKDWAVQKQGKFLDREGGLVVWHWQAH